MTITKRLLELDPSLQAFAEGFWHDSTIKPGPGEFSSFNDAGIECETGEFLYSLVRLLKPENILETGTHWGIGASYMGMGLKDNGRGHLDTIEFLADIHYRALQRIQQLDLSQQVTCHFGDVRDFNPHGQSEEPVNPGKYQLILLDTEPQTRFEELIRFEKYLAPGGFLFIHDLHRHMAQVDRVHPDHPETPFWPWGELPKAMKDLVNSGQLRPFHFSTPRGFTGFYKTSPNDYDWDK